MNPLRQIRVIDGMLVTAVIIFAGCWSASRPRNRRRALRFFRPRGSGSAVPHGCSGRRAASLV